MTTTVAAVRGTRYGLGILSVRTPCGQIWGHDGSIFGYRSFAFADLAGTRSGVLLVPTTPDGPIASAVEAALTRTICHMFGRTDSAVPSSARGGPASVVAGYSVLTVSRRPASRYRRPVAGR